jgi:replication factor C small subunit
MSNHYDQLWVHKYAPKTLEDIVLDPKHREYFTCITEDVPNLLFYGPPGSGKSLASKVIVRDILKCQYLYINASDESGIDTIRSKVTNFAQTRSLDGKRKVVILDEFDGTSGEAQRALRNLMEEYSDTTRFILTANYFNKIIAPIKSRCELVQLTPDFEGCMKRCCYILLQEKVKIDEAQKGLLRTFLEERYPDLRRMINDLQKYSITGSLQIPIKRESSNLAATILGSLMQKVSALNLRKMVIESERAFNSDFQQLLKDLFESAYVCESLRENHKKALLVEIGEFMYKDNQVLDHEINFYCCLQNLENILGSK